MMRDPGDHGSSASAFRGAKRLTESLGAVMSRPFNWSKNRLLNESDITLASVCYLRLYSFRPHEVLIEQRQPGASP